MLFSVITPSFNQLDWLRLCVRSVADQAAQAGSGGQGTGRDTTSLEIEHIVQDGGTKSLEGGNVEKWKRENLPTFPPSHVPTSSLHLFTEPDSGMYDAINRGFRRATGDICAYLNCDEQYLPDALDAVARYFNAHPDVDVVFADAVVVDENGGYLCSRLAQTPFRDQLWFRMPVLSCATFIRRSAIERHGL
ncbi:MAG: glycosyltransferase, partial [Terrimicrobiaceae bacterium]